MRFLRPLLACVTLASAVSFQGVDAATFQIDATGDNNFQVYISRASSPSTVTHLNAGGEMQTNWQTPSVYTGIELTPNDVVSIYLHNDVSTDQQRETNPSALVARIRETLDGTLNNFKVGGGDFISDQQWICAWRHETVAEEKDYDPSRLTTHPDNWARADFDLTVNWMPLPGQNGGSFIPTWESAYELKKLGDPTSIWSKVGDDLIEAAMSGPTFNSPETPYWIYGNDQLDPTDETVLAHHGWCRFKIPRVGPATGQGDPVFTGFQGQVYQFHGLPDEHFNLVSSPQVQLNAHFVYLSSGKCDYNDTACYTHPGTYMDVLGFTIAETRVKLVAGTHEAGLRVWVNDIELPRGGGNFSLSEKTQASITFDKYGKVHIRTEIMDFEVSNSDMFMNVGVALMNQELLRVGSKKHTITDKVICKHNEESYNHEFVEARVAKKYPISTPLHGLIGQTWRNLKICGREWMGTVQDYVVSSLFGTDYHYKYFQY